MSPLITAGLFQKIVNGDNSTSLVKRKGILKKKNETKQYSYLSMKLKQIYLFQHYSEHKKNQRFIKLKFNLTSFFHTE